MMTRNSRENQNIFALRKGIIELLVLHLLSKQDMYGYQLRTELDQRSNGYFRLPDASLYPTLYRLSERGFISEREDHSTIRRRKYYHLEESGRERLEETMREYANINNSVNLVLSRESFDDADTVEAPAEGE